jgi:phosphatidylethanolamine/phosphatidyl-N-methylethanolamine N-methyltransferase
MILLADPDRGGMERAYARWAPVYDVLCGPVFSNARRAATQAAKNAGRAVLEVGVGTGLSFKDYGPQYEITGIDISEPMIARARMRCSTGDYPWVRALLAMDASDMAFPPESFHSVVAQFLITLVEQPETVLDACARVLKPGGEIILVNHFYSEKGLAARIETGLAKKARKVGLRPDFPFGRIEAWAKAHGGVEIVEKRKIAPFRVFTLVRIRKL